MADSSDEDDTTMNQFNFFRAPIGPPPELEEPPPPPAPRPPAPAVSTAPPAAAAPSAAPVHKQPSNAGPIMINPLPRPGFEHLATRPVPVDELPTDEIKRRLEDFAASFKKRHGRPIALSDAKDLPVQIMALYDQLGRRLSPEERAKTDELMATKKAEAAAAAAAKAAERDAFEAARAKRWAEFEENKDALWASASSEAKEQRVEAADEAGLDVSALAGAASFVKLDEGAMPTPSHPTREEYLQQALDAHGFKFVPDGPSEEEKREEATAWARAGGADADDAARRDQWAAASGSAAPGSATT